MSLGRTPRYVFDLAALPESASGSTSTVWWGNVGFMLIEGTVFALAAGTYLYLQSQSPAWPPAGDARPDLLWSAIFTASLLLSEIANRIVSHFTKAKNGAAVRRGVALMTLIGIIVMGMRWLEFDHLNVRWDRDAYGSVVWLLMILHTSHVLTDLGDTAVQAIWLYTHDIGDDQFADVQDNCNYWTFVVGAWLPIYALIYWAPRL
jgi:cytochrome c oxidase subunit 3